MSKCIANVIQYNEVMMKTATFPPIRVTPELREATESVLSEDETLSKFAEQAIRALVERRQAQNDFIQRGLTSRDKARQAGHYISAEQVMDDLNKMYEQAKLK